MKQGLICKDLIVQDNIRSEFHLYLESISELPISSKYIYLLEEQRRRLDKYHLVMYYEGDMDDISEFNYPIKFPENLYMENQGFKRSVYPYIIRLIKKGTIPKRYMPKIEEIVDKTKYTVNFSAELWKGHWQLYYRDFKTEWGSNRFIELNRKDKHVRAISLNVSNAIIYKLIFKEAIISLLIQKKLDKNIISFFRDSIEKDQGISFDDYINKWTKKIMKEMYILEID